MSEKCNRELDDFYFSRLLKWQTWDLATDLGFASSQHFAARFRRETGKTPSEYRAQRG